MIKYIFLVLFTLIIYPILGQQKFILTGKIIDKESKNALPFANIICKTKSLGANANPEGDFTFSIFNSYKTDSIIISYMGYYPLKLNITDCLKKEIFELSPKIFVMSEVVVHGNKFKLKNYMSKVVHNYNLNKRDESHIAIAHYREKAKTNDKYVMFMESIGYSIFSGDQVNASPLSNYKFFCENSKCAVVNPLWLKFNENLEDSQDQKIPPACGSNLNVFRYIEIKGLLSLDHWSKYTYKLDSTYFINKQSVYSIHFKGKGNRGYIHVYGNSHKIIKIDCETNKYWSTIFQTRIKARVNLRFSYFGTTPFISNIDSYYNQDGLEHYNSMQIITQKLNEFTLSREEYWDMNAYEHNPFITYLPEKWKDFNISHDINFNNIKNDLALTGLSLEEQFIAYSGRWFFSKKKGDETIRMKINELKEEVFNSDN